MRGVTGAVIAVVAVACSSLASASGLPKVLTQEKPAFQVRPATISYTGDGTGIVGGLDGTSVRHLGRLHWSTYNSRRGFAIGRVWLDDCSPDCADGTFTPSRVRVQVFDPSRGHFRRLTLSYRYRGRDYVDRRLAHYYAGVSGSPGYWSYAICGVRYSAKC